MWLLIRRAFKKIRNILNLNFKIAVSDLNYF